MKRRELERKLRMAGCYLKRERDSHSLLINPKIKEPLAKKILKNLNAE